MLLKCPELDLRLVTTCAGDTPYRAKVAAKPAGSGRPGDVPVGIGIQQKDTRGGPQAPWVANYDLEQYPGRIDKDGVEALIRDDHDLALTRSR